MPLAQLGSVGINYHSVGSGKTVVMVHGLGANQAFWFFSVGSVLASEFRVVSYDLRGHGRSSMPERGYDLGQMAKDLHGLLNQLDVESVHLVGHSFGARVALAAALLHPDRIDSLTLADTQLSSIQPRMRLADWPHWPAWKRQLAAQGVTPLPDDEEPITFHLLASFNRHAGAVTSGAAGARPLTRPSLRSRDMGRRGSAQWSTLLKTTSALTEFEDEKPLTIPNLKTIRVPVLGVYGEYSHCVPTGNGLAQILPDYRLVMIPRAGHFHPAVRPRLFTRVLRTFLLRQSSPGGTNRPHNHGRLGLVGDHNA